MYFPAAVCAAKLRSKAVLFEPATGVTAVTAMRLPALSRDRLSGVKLDGTTAWLNVRRIVPSVWPGAASL